MSKQNEEKEIKMPEDLGIEFGTEAQAFWTRTRDKVKENILNYERQIIIDNDLIKLCERKILEEKAKI